MKNNKGFTLVEVVLVVSILSVVMLAIGAMIVSNIKSNKHAQNIGETQQYAEIVMAELRDSTYDASKIDITDSSGGSYEDVSKIFIGDAGSEKAAEFVADGYTLIPSGYIVLSETVYTDFKNKSGKTVNEKIKYEVKDNQFIIVRGTNRYVIASDIDSIALKALPENDATPTKFKDCTGVKVIVNFKKYDKGIDKSAKIDYLTNQFYFRNNEFK